MKLIFLIMTSFFLIGLSYLKRTEIYTGNILKNTEELWNGQNQGAIQQFCEWKGYTNVAYFKTEKRSLKTVVCIHQ